MEQFDRAHRYLVRIRSIYAGIYAGDHKKQEYEDDVLSFFVHCFHIKDWIVHLNKIGVTAKQVDEFINASECLKICADLCNGTKHCILTRSARTGRQPHMSGRQYKSSVWFTGSGGGEVVQGKYSIVTAAGVVDALNLAEECMRSWENFIGSKRMEAM